MLEKPCIKDHQNFLSHIFTFTVFFYVLNFWWAVVILLTIHLFDHVFNAPKIEEEPVGNKLSFQRKTKVAIRRKIQGSPQQFMTKSVFQEESFSDNLAPSVTGFNMAEEKIYSSSNLKSNVSQRPLSSKANSKSSFMSLMQRKFKLEKENIRPNVQQQPIVSTVKNNMSLRNAQSSFESYPKTPLYNHYRQRCLGSPQVNNSPYSPSTWVPLETSKVVSNHDTKFVSFLMEQSEEKYAASPTFQDSETNKTSAYDGLEVHGSYFINKSLINSGIGELAEDSALKSYAKTKRLTQSNAKPCDQTTQQPFAAHDTTSTEAVITILREKSKRKRSRAVQSPTTDYSKRIRFDSDGSIVNDISSVTGPYRKPLAMKKRMVSTSTQCDAEYVQSMKKVRKITPTTSPSTSKFGLTETQTDSMMGEELRMPDTTNKSAGKVSVKESLVRGRSSDKSFMNFSFLSGSDITKQGSNMESPSNQSLSFTKLSEKSDETLNLSTVHKNLMKTSLQSLKNSNTESNLPCSLQEKKGADLTKSPYKRIIPPAFTPGSASKLRKYPVYFTARIDIDEIQKNREEFGSKGISLKAYRYEQEKSAKLVSDIFDEASVTDTGTVSSSMQSTESVNLFKSAASATKTASSVVSVNPISSSLSKLSEVQTASQISIPTINIVPSSTPAVSSNITGFVFPVSKDTSSSRVASVQMQKSLLPAPFPVSSATSMATVAAASSGSVPLVVSSVSNTMAPTPPQSIAATFGKPFSSTFTSSTLAFSFGVPKSEENKVVGATSSGLAFNSTVTIGGATSTAPTFTGLFATAKTESATSLSSTNTVSSATNSTTMAVIAQPLNAGRSLGLKPLNETSTFGSSTPSITNVKLKATISLPESNIASSIASSVSNNTAAAVAATSTQSTSFGNIATTSNKILGNEQAAKPGGFSFGMQNTSNSKSSFNSPTPTFNFGVDTKSSVNQQQVSQSNQPSTTTPSIFGQPTSPITSSLTNLSSFNGFKKKEQSGSVANTSVAFQNVFSTPVSTSTTVSSIFGQQVDKSDFQFGNAPTPATQASAFNFTSSSQPSIFGNTPNQNPFSVSNVNVTAQTLAAPTPSASMFGAQTTISGTFGALPVTTTSIFGNQPVSNSSIFGAAPNNQVSIFGAPATSATNIKLSAFGAPPSTAAAIFGAPATTGSIFGAPTTTATSVFGAPASTASIFGASAASSCASTPFGSSASNSIFGAKSAANISNPFGQQAPQQSTGFNFSASMKQAPTFDFGAQKSAPNAFGLQPSQTSFSFNGQPSTPTLGVPSAPNFGTPTFGTPQASPFATPNFNAPAAGGFSMGTGATQQGNRQTTRARRRLKR